jgi:hypothetical protein
MADPFTPDNPWSRFPSKDYDWAIGGRPAMKDWDDFLGRIVNRYTGGTDKIKDRAATYAQLYYNPAYRELQRKRAQAGREYQRQRGEVEPWYQRSVAEKMYGLDQQLATSAAARAAAEQDYGISDRRLAEANSSARNKLLADYARRGLTQSGILNRAMGGANRDYMTSLGDLQRTRFNRLADINRTGENAQRQALFNISATQDERNRRLNDLLRTRTQAISDADLRQQQLGEEQGQRAAQQYDTLMDQYRDFALKARGQEFGERMSWNDVYWNEQKFLEDMRRWGLEYAMKMQQMNRYYGGGGSPFRSSGTPPPQSPPPMSDDEKKQAMRDWLTEFGLNVAGLNF